MQSNSLRKIASDISPDILELAQREELGELRKVYTITKRNTAPFGIGMICLTFGVIITPFILTPPRVIAIPGLILLIVGCYLVFSRRLYARMSSRWCIYLWQHGFIHEKGRNRQVFRWEQIDTIHRQGNPQFSCKVCRQDGYKISVSSAFSERGELINIISEEFVRQHATQDLIIAPSSSVRTFTYMKLDRQGIGNGQEVLSWQDMDQFMTKNGVVILRKKEEYPLNWHSPDGDEHYDEP